MNRVSGFARRFKLARHHFDVEYGVAVRTKTIPRDTSPPQGPL